MTDELSGAVAKGVRDALIAAHHATVDNHHAKVDEARTAFMERMERELAQVFRETGLIDFTDPKLSDEVRQAWASIIEPTHQGDFAFNLLATLGVAFSGAFAAAAGINQQLTERGLNKSADIKPDPQVTAGMQVRGIVTDATANTWYADVGTKGKTQQAYVDAAWNQLPAATVIELVRRRKIVEDRGRAILRLNGLTPESVEDLLTLVVGPPDYGLLTAAVTQSELTTGEFADLLPQVGIDPKWADLIYKTNGSAMPPDMSARLFREGWMTEEAYRTALLKSPIKNEYVDLMTKLRFRYPPMRQTLKMYSDGLIDAPTAQSYLEKLGYFPVDAANLVKASAKHSTTSVKNLSPSVIERLYEVGKFDRGTAQTHLETLGYDATEADLLLVLVDESKTHAAQVKAANQVGTRYVGWKIDRNTASQALDSLQVPAGARDTMLTDWDVIRETRTQHLTEAFMKKAHKAGHMTVTDVLARLRAYGYDQVDADLIIATDFT